MRPWILIQKRAFSLLLRLCYFGSFLCLRARIFVWIVLWSEQLRWFKEDAVTPGLGLSHGAVSTMALFPHPWLQVMGPLLYTEDRFDSPLVKQNELPDFFQNNVPWHSWCYVPMYAVCISGCALMRRKKIWSLIITIYLWWLLFLFDIYAANRHISL